MSEETPRDPRDELSQKLQELYRDVRELRRDLYGNPNIREPGIFERLDRIEERHEELLRRYEREMVEKSYLAKIEEELAQLKLDSRVLMVLLKAAVGGVGTILITLVGAIAVGVLRFGASPASLLQWWTP